MTNLKKIWVIKNNSFKEAEKNDLKYYLKMSAIERLSIVQFLRELYFSKFKKDKLNEYRKGLRRVITIVEKT